MPDVLDAILAFALALVVVWISTPVVKSLAWRIGAIDEPRARGLHQMPTARLGGVAILAGDRLPRARLPALRPADHRHPDRRDGDRGGGSRRRPARSLRRREARGPGARGGDARRRGRARRDDDAAVRRTPRPRRLVVSADGDRDRRGHEHRQLHRRRGRPCRGRVHDRGPDVRGDRAVARPQRGGRAGDADRGRVARLPAPRLPPGLDLPGRLRARTCSGTCWPRSRCRAR